MKKDDPAFLKLTPLFHQPLPFFEKNRTPPLLCSKISKTQTPIL